MKGKIKLISLGIESTAHTFGIGIFDGKVRANAKDTYVPKKGGIHPMEAREHHTSVSKQILDKALKEAGLEINNIDIVSYSAGPGLPPCLLVGAKFARELSTELIPVNHCIAHIEIGRFLCKSKDPLTLYVSGGNTQVVGFAGGRYRVFGETHDMAIGNAIDTLIRELTGTYPGGPLLDRLSEGGKYIEMPYVVKGMDLSFSGILTSAIQKYRKGNELKDVLFSFRETCYSMLTEVTERALAHTGKKELLLTGGVAASLRLQEMLGIMCNERGVKMQTVPSNFAGDNGAMIAYTGMIAYQSGQKFIKEDIKQKWRTDEVDITWRKN